MSILKTNDQVTMHKKRFRLLQPSTYKKATGRNERRAQRDMGKEEAGCTDENEEVEE